MRFENKTNINIREEFGTKKEYLTPIKLIKNARQLKSALEDLGGQDDFDEQLFNIRNLCVIDHSVDEPTVHIVKEDELGPFVNVMWYKGDELHIVKIESWVINGKLYIDESKLW